MKLFAPALAALALAILPAAAMAETVTVTLTGVEARGGQILATLQTEGDFMQPRGTAHAAIQAPAQPGAVTIVFENVPAGAYAFSAFHDANGDYQMQREANGSPQEGWAMTNGTSLRATPTFAQVSFNVAAEAVSLSEPMIYPRAR